MLIFFKKMNLYGSIPINAVKHTQAQHMTPGKCVYQREKRVARQKAREDEKGSD